MDVNEALAEVRHLVADETWVGVVELDVRHLRVWLNERDVLAAEVRRLRTYEETAPVLAKMIDEIKEALGAPPWATHAEVLARIELTEPRATEGEP